MPLEDKRSSYVLEFVQSLGDPDNEVEAEELLKILTETLTETLVQVEKRFSMYRDKMDPGKSVKRLQKEIARAEKHINARANDKDMPGTPTSEKRFGFRHIHREALKNCYKLMTDDLDLFKTTLMDDLLASDVVSISDKDSIRGRDTQKRQNEEFYAYLVGRLTLDEFHSIFLPSLCKDHQHVADALVLELDRLETEYQDSQCVACRARKHIEVKRLASPLLMLKVIDLPMFTDLRSPSLSNSSKWAELRGTVSDADIIKAMEKKYPDFHEEFQLQGRASFDCFCPPQAPFLSPTSLAGLEESVPDLDWSQETGASYDTCLEDVMDSQNDQDLDEFFQLFQTENTEEVYQMTALPRGICLIINNMKFKSPYTPRPDIDAEKIKQLFTKLQFTVDVVADQTTDEMVKTLYYYACKDHSKFDAFACIILTHGTIEGIVGCDGKVLPVKDVTSPFTASNCPSLLDKPKLFFIDAERGHKVMFSGNRQTSESKCVPPDDADFVVGFSTPDGYVNYRNQSRGSLYVQALTQILDSHSDQSDLLACMLMVNKEVSQYSKYLGSFTYKQVPAPVFTLTKKVHLTTDPLWPYSETRPEDEVEKKDCNHPAH